jgi:glutathione S-transferase
MESELAEKAWLSGERFGLADATLLPYVLRLEHLGMDPVLSATERPRVAEWLSRAKTLPCYATAVEAWAPAAIVEMMRSQGKDLWPDIEPITRRTSNARG